MAKSSPAVLPSAASSENRLRALSDPSSGVVALPTKNRPKRRRHASRLLAKDLALLPVANGDDHAEREKRTNAMAARTDKRRSPYLSYFSTLLAAIALGTSIGTAAISSMAQGAVTPDEVIHPAHVEITVVTVSAT